VTAAEILAALVALAIKYGPGAVDVVEAIIADFKAQHPQLNDAPPADGEAKVDASIDAEAAAKHPASEAIVP
jgi:hypothetical protein